MPRGLPKTLARADLALVVPTTTKRGAVKKTPARANTAAPTAFAAPAPVDYEAPAAGAVAVTSDAATDLTDLAEAFAEALTQLAAANTALATLRGEFATHVTNHNDLLAKLRTAGLVTT